MLSLGGAALGVAARLLPASRCCGLAAGGTAACRRRSAIDLRVLLHGDRPRRRHRASSSASSRRCSRRGPISSASLKEGGRSATAGGRAQRLRSVLVVAEVALAVMLLVGAGLFTGSFVQLMRIDPGFDYRNVIALNVGLRLVAGEQFT